MLRTAGLAAVRATLRALTEADLAQVRQNELLELKDLGAGSLTQQ